ncbi:target of Nesh-SH3 isoform X39 [Canis lupus familiaris]|uniref:target of Nesh-SH3 isoform X39 n=1 Tax=Canis lupus familiaris TaxID=9615 RepID=UPI000DC6A53F|nr:target of Nesh-SH3 isoform X39 [Canis lupus familiaris]XP_025272144.1 target of Nesh-SH3 isoform X39 [Canis lupus dingo]XP_038438587.1 target of Nesh-SH3 isoform X39 [Canis lupus familiaris]
MLSSLGCLLLCGSIALSLGNAQKLPKGKRPSLKVHINTTSDSILLKFLRPNPNVKLEGFLLGYGSNLSPNQYFPLPAEGKFTEAVVDAEPKYLIVVRPAPPPSQKKSCSGKARSRKPLQLVVGTLTPSSVFLSWGFLINPHHDWTLPSHCPNDRYYTIRYREKDKEKKWVFQICPATETIVENLKPNTVYEFGVKDNGEGGIWSKIFNHKTVVGSKNKVNGKIQSTYDQIHTVPAYVPRKLIPITVIKQVIQNVTHRASTKSPDKTPFGGTILVHLIIPGLNETTVKLPTSIMLEISDAIKTQLAKNETLALPAESKTPEVEKIPAQPITVTPESMPRTTKPTVSSALDFSEKTLASSEKPWIGPTSKTSEDSKLLPPQTATYDVFSSPTPSDEPEMSEPHTATSDPFLDSVPPKTSRTLEQPRATLAPSETPFVPQKLEIFTSPEMPPTTPAAQQTTSIPSTPKRRIRPKTPRTKPERTTSPGTITSKIPKSPEPTWTTLAPSKTQFISLKPKIPLIPEVTYTKPAPKQTPRAPPKPKTSPHPRIPQTQPARKVSQSVTSKPKTSPSPEVSHTPPVPRDVLLPPKPDPEVSQSEPAPLETRGSPSIPMISPSTSQAELPTTLAETHQSTQGVFTTKIPLTTELAKTTPAPHRLYTTSVRPRTPDKVHIRPVLNKTTTRPSRLKPSRMPKGNGMGTGIKQAPKPSGAGKNVSVDSPHSTKKPAAIPGTRRPPLPPRPVPPRRKPLPPNNVTGKPGSAGVISSGQVTSPPPRATLRPTEAPSERTETFEKQPTAPASGEDLGNITDFSSSPTRETDPLGKPRFKGPHVRYIQKPDNRPCSITDSVKRFPKEDATEGNATSPPQNPPTNLTVVTVEGCPSFVILDWDKPLNDTVTEYEVISRENGSFSGKNKSIQITNQTFSTVENLKPDTSYEFQVKPKNPLGEGPASNTVAFSTESADPRVSEPVSAGRDAIWTERPFNSDSYSECKGKQYVKRTWYKKFVGVQLCNSLRYKIYLSDSLTGKFYNIGDQRGHGEDHCQFVDSFLDGRTGQQLSSDQLPTKEGYFRAVRQEPVQFGEIGGHTQINYVQWYECGTTIPGKW